MPSCFPNNIWLQHNIAFYKNFGYIYTCHDIANNQSKKYNCWLSNIFQRNSDIECTVSFKAIRFQWLYFEYCLLLKQKIDNNPIKEEESAKNTLQ